MEIDYYVLFKSVEEVEKYYNKKIKTNTPELFLTELNKFVKKYKARPIDYIFPRLLGEDLAKYWDGPRPISFEELKQRVLLKRQENEL